MADIHTSVYVGDGALSGSSIYGGVTIYPSPYTAGGIPGNWPRTVLETCGIIVQDKACRGAVDSESADFSANGSDWVYMPKAAKVSYQIRYKFSTDDWNTGPWTVVTCSTAVNDGLSYFFLDMTEWDITKVYDLQARIVADDGATEEGPIVSNAGDNYYFKYYTTDWVNLPQADEYTQFQPTAAAPNRNLIPLDYHHKIISMASTPCAVYSGQVAMLRGECSHSTAGGTTTVGCDFKLDMRPVNSSGALLDLGYTYDFGSISNVISWDDGTPGYYRYTHNNFNEDESTQIEEDMNMVAASFDGTLISARLVWYTPGLFGAGSIGPGGKPIFGPGFFGDYYYNFGLFERSTSTSAWSIKINNYDASQLTWNQADSGPGVVMYLQVEKDSNFVYVLHYTASSELHLGINKIENDGSWSYAGPYDKDLNIDQGDNIADIIEAVWIRVLAEGKVYISRPSVCYRVIENVNI